MIDVRADSITCGYGALGVAPCPGYSCGAPADAPKNSSNWESGYYSYRSVSMDQSSSGSAGTSEIYGSMLRDCVCASLVLGRWFSADTQTICVSGAGFAHQWNKPGVSPTQGGSTNKSTAGYPVMSRQFLTDFLWLQEV